LIVARNSSVPRGNGITRRQIAKHFQNQTSLIHRGSAFNCCGNRFSAKRTPRDFPDHFLMIAALGQFLAIVCNNEFINLA